MEPVPTISTSSVASAFLQSTATAAIWLLPQSATTTDASTAKSTPTGSMALALEVAVSRGGGEGGSNPLSRSRIKLLISGQGTGIHSVKSALMSRKNTKLLRVKVLLLILPRRITYMLSSLTVLRSVTLVQHALARRCVSSIEDLNM